MMTPNKNTMFIKRSDRKNIKPDEEEVKRRHAIEDHQATRPSVKDLRDAKSFKEVWGAL